MRCGVLSQLPQPPEKAPSPLTLRALHEDAAQVGQDPVAPPEAVLAQGGCTQGLGGMEQLLSEEHLPLWGEWGVVRGLQPPREAEPQPSTTLLTLASFSICRSSSGMLDADVSAWGRDGSVREETPEGGTPTSAPQQSPEHPTSSSRRDFRPRVSSSSSTSSPVSSVRRELRRRRPSSSPVISDSGRPVFLARATFSLQGHGLRIRVPVPTPPGHPEYQGQRGRC